MTYLSIVNIKNGKVIFDDQNCDYVFLNSESILHIYVYLVHLNMFKA